MRTMSRIGGLLAGTALAAGATMMTAPAQAHDGTPCDARAEACIDLSAGQTWLMSDGEVTYGPVPMSSGKPGYETRPGTFAVTYKDKDHWSGPYDAPMPYSVFFTEDGIAYHEGNINEQSHGCVRLQHEAAKKFFYTLEPGDTVQVAP